MKGKSSTGGMPPCQCKTLERLYNSIDLWTLAALYSESLALTVPQSFQPYLLDSLAGPGKCLLFEEGVANAESTSMSNLLQLLFDSNTKRISIDITICTLREPYQVIGELQEALPRIDPLHASVYCHTLQEGCVKA